LTLSAGSDEVPTGAWASTGQLSKVTIAKALPTASRRTLRTAPSCDLAETSSNARTRYFSFKELATRLKLLTVRSQIYLKNRSIRSPPHRWVPRFVKKFWVCLGVDGNNQPASPAKKLVNAEVIDVTAVGEENKAAILLFVIGLRHGCAALGECLEQQIKRPGNAPQSHLRMSLSFQIKPGNAPGNITRMTNPSTKSDIDRNADCRCPVAAHTGLQFRDGFELSPRHANMTGITGTRIVIRRAGRLKQYIS
jgi:hypothetical protein